MPESESELLGALIGDIYDAALDASLWPGVIAKAVQFLPGMSGALFSKDTVNKTGNVYYDDGTIDPHYKQIYFEKYVKLDPANTGHFFAEIETPVSTTDLLPYDEFVETRFYKEWVQPQGMVDFVSAVLDRSATSAALFGIFRHDRHGLIDDESRRRMRLIVPHVRRAVLIGKVIDLKTAEAATLADALDGITAGMILVDSRGQVVHTNGVGQAILVDGDLLYVSGGRLAAPDPKTNDTLNDIFASTSGGDAAIGVKGIALPLMSRDGSRYMAHVSAAHVGSASEGRGRLFRQRGSVRAQSAARAAADAGGDRQALWAHAERAARAARRIRVRRCGRHRGRPRYLRGDRQDALAPAVRQDEHPAPGRPGQAGGRLRCRGAVAGGRTIIRKYWRSRPLGHPSGGRGAVARSIEILTQRGWFGGAAPQGRRTADAPTLRSNRLRGSQVASTVNAIGDGHDDPARRPLELRAPQMV